MIISFDILKVYHPRHFQMDSSVGLNMLFFFSGQLSVSPSPESVHFGQVVPMKQLPCPLAPANHQPTCYKSGYSKDLLELKYLSLNAWLISRSLCPHGHSCCCMYHPSLLKLSNRYATFCLVIHLLLHTRLASTSSQ